MKIFSSILFLFSLTSFIYAEALPPPNEKECVMGTIRTYTYMNNKVYIKLNDSSYELYTDRTFSFPFIMRAYNNHMRVIIYTDSCYDGGGFSKIKFYH